MILARSFVLENDVSYLSAADEGARNNAVPLYGYVIIVLFTFKRKFSILYSFVRHWFVVLRSKKTSLLLFKILILDFFFDIDIDLTNGFKTI